MAPLPADGDGALWGLGSPGAAPISGGERGAMPPRDSGDAAGIAPGGAEPADAAAASSPCPKNRPLVINNPSRGPPRQDPPVSLGVPGWGSPGPLPLLGQEQPRIPQRVPGHIPARRAIPVIPAIPVRRQH